MEKNDIKKASVWACLQPEPLDLRAADAFLRTPDVGGVTLFVGTTRQWTDGRETARLEYEAYEAMALQEMLRIGEEAQEQWPSLHRACLFHRLGIIPPREASVLCGAATPHRAAAFAACRFLIDRLKDQVPIWKREVYADGEARWIKAASLSDPQQP